MKKLVLLFAFVLATTHFTFGQVDEAYKSALKEMFKVSGSEETFKTAITQMVSMYKQQNINVPAEVWDELEAEFLKSNLDDLVGFLAPVYAKYLTTEDLKEISAFYESPVGKKFASNQSAIVQESMQVGQQWGMKIGQELQQRLQEKGY